MNNKNKIMLGAVGLLMIGQVLGAPSEDEIAQLGKTLTPMGAIKAASADGTIPAWDGGVCKPPSDYKPIMGDKGGSPYADLFNNEKPLYVITAANMAKYDKQLDEGNKELLKRYPDSYKLEVYPTHRTACYPQFVYDNTIKNVRKPKLVGSAPGVADAHAQVPFPIPKSGYEVMWNALLRYEVPYMEGSQDAYLIDTSGGKTLTSTQTIANRNLYWDNSLDSVPANQPYWALIATTTAPSSQVGTKQLRQAFLDPDQRDSMAWSYIPGQRRVRLAPEFKYDTVSTTSGGVLLFDEIQGFDGKMDKFDFKLLGRREMLVPYNDYKAWAASSDQINAPKHVNPDLMRWELHRVWVVEGTLKPGERHVQKVKRFYIDEDSWTFLAYNSEDQSGKIQHVIHFPAIQQYEKPAFRSSQYLLYDLSKGVYANGSMMGAPGKTGFAVVQPWSSNFFTPSSLAGTGVR
ncbi:MULTISPECIES: DUF1329 domain-containing protein [unclassified Pseudomonas]|uniref:DUF1329 domain-containing protein n=1 Tax=unclassified Pseudomonas TaxID=196821 RepID=UPI0025FBE797|nr:MULTISPECIES: DUF1329 domain-containing protein [unclassified Pseudomonas]